MSNALAQMCLFLMIRRPPGSTQSRSSAASDVYKRQGEDDLELQLLPSVHQRHDAVGGPVNAVQLIPSGPVSYTHLRAHETVLDLVCRLLLEKKPANNKHPTTSF